MEYWEDQQCLLDNTLSSDDSSREEAYGADVECSGTGEEDEGHELPPLPSASESRGEG
jgi:hypothetical protein